MLSLPKSSEVCFDEYPLFPTEESKHQVSTKKVGFKVFVKVNAKRNKHRMWLDQAQNLNLKEQKQSKQTLKTK